MQAVLFIPVQRVHLVCSAEVFSNNTEAFKPVISDAYLQRQWAD